MNSFLKFILITQTLFYLIPSNASSENVSEMINGRDFAISLKQHRKLTNDDIKYFPSEMKRHLGLSRLHQEILIETNHSFIQPIRGGYLIIVNHVGSQLSGSYGAIIDRGTFRQKELSAVSNWYWRPLVLPRLDSNNTPYTEQQFRYIDWNTELKWLHITECNDQLVFQSKYSCMRTYFYIETHLSRMQRIDFLNYSNLDKYDTVWQDGKWLVKFD